MGMYHSTYFAYGLHIPVDGPAWAETDRIDSELAKLKDRCPDVGHLSAGHYDDDMVFLVTKTDEVRLGSYGRANLATDEERAAWNLQLAHAVVALGYDELPDLAEPGWLCIPDLS
ncbi:hypothetical protein ACH5A7_21045 [Streptomyces sp. NPDC018955]|uniref:hypothetical protein n=1 Tax=Streptomyces sp. NPDC018955 TaxID=3365055 RepID=UPI0037985AD7